MLRHIFYEAKRKVKNSNYLNIDCNQVTKLKKQNPNISNELAP